jgi:hypothetical protein
VILRSLAVLVFAAGAAALVAGLALLGRAPGLPEATRHLRAMKDRLDPPARVEPFEMREFAELPHVMPLAARAAIEARGVQMTGWVQRMMLSGDGDLHLELVETPRPPGERDSAYVVAEVTPLWREHAPGWAYDSLLVALRPNRGGRTPWEAGPRRVRLTGWLLFDHPYDRQVSSWSLLHGAPRRTGWEIHPVTRIELWDSAQGSWQELRR